MRMRQTWSGLRARSCTQRVSGCTYLTTRTISPRARRTLTPQLLQLLSCPNPSRILPLAFHNHRALSPNLRTGTNRLQVMFHVLIFFYNVYRIVYSALYLFTSNFCLLCRPKFWIMTIDKESRDDDNLLRLLWYKRIRGITLLYALGHEILNTFTVYLRSWILFLRKKVFTIHNE